MGDFKRVGMFLYGVFPKDERVRREALFLSQNGYQITVFAFADSLSFKKRDLFHNIIIYRMLYLPNREARINIYKLFSFWISCILFITRHKLYFDVIHCHDLPTLPVGIFMKIISRVKVIYDSHELFPDAAFEKLGFFYGIICLALERALIRFSDQIIGVSIPQSIIMKRRYSLDDFLIIRNCPMINQPYTPENVPNNLVNINPSKINIVNSGSLIKGRGYFTFLGVIEMIKTIRNDFHVYILGDGPLMPFLANYIQDSKLADIVTMVGHVPEEFFFDILSKFDIGISLYEETPNNKYSQPNTVYDYMISGLAVIFPFYPGNIEVLGEIDAINITVSDKESIISAIEYLLENPDQIKLRGKKARKKFESKFNWEAINASLVNLYHEL